VSSYATTIVFTDVASSTCLAPRTNSQASPLREPKPYYPASVS
jgi:hypothetical protein